MPATLHITDAARALIAADGINIHALFSEHKRRSRNNRGVKTQAFRLPRGGALVFTSDSRGPGRTLVVTGREYQIDGQDDVVKARLVEWDRKGAAH
jgi:hypothetical protein